MVKDPARFLRLIFRKNVKFNVRVGIPESFFVFFRPQFQVQDSFHDHSNDIRRCQPSNVPYKSGGISLGRA